MPSLAERIRTAREQWVTVGGREFLVRRPTDVQIGQWAGMDIVSFVMRCVVGWKLPEHELVAGGGGKVPAFDTEAFQEWIGDRPDDLAELAKKINEIIEAHHKKKAEVEKN